jgi:hypothetical protein
MVGLMESDTHNCFLQPADRPVIDELVEHETVFAKSQPPYHPLRALRSQTPEGRVMSRWTLTAEQRKAVAEGADVFLELLTFGDLLQPIRMLVAQRIDSGTFAEFYELANTAYQGEGQPRRV